MNHVTNAFRPGPASGLISKADLAGPALYATARERI